MQIYLAGQVNCLAFRLLFTILFSFHFLFDFSLCFLTPLNLRYLGVINRLVSVFILNAEPSLFVLLLISFLRFVDSHRQQNHNIRYIEVTKRQFYFPIIVNHQCFVSKVLTVTRVLKSLDHLAIRSNCSNTFAVCNDKALRDKLRSIRFTKWIVTNCECDVVQTVEFQLKEFIYRVLNRVLFAILQMLFGKFFQIIFKLVSLLLLKRGQSSVKIPDKLLGKRSHRNWLIWIEDKVDDSPVLALNGPSLLLLSLLLNHKVLDFTFLITNRNELVGYSILNKLSGHFMLEHVVQNTFVEYVLVGDVKLVIETTPPLFLVNEVLHASHEAVLQELFRKV